MIAAVHQPNYLPWIGFFAKAAAADVLIAMDNVQFPRNSWVNRVRVGGNGPPQWLTVPVRHSGQLHVWIRDVEISWESDWSPRQLRTLEQRYARSPWAGRILEPIERVLRRRHRFIADQNLELIESILALCSIDRRIVRGSRLEASGSASALIAGMCRQVGATEYLAGQGAVAYDDEEVYSEAKIAYRRLPFSHPRYEQRGHDTFEPGLSIVDVLMNCGPERTQELILSSVLPPT